MLHAIRKFLRRLLGPKGLDRNVPLSVNERRYYHVQCEACVADDMAWMESEVDK